jgi:colicin import membrane protein
MNIAIAPGMNVLATVETLTALDVFTGDAHIDLVERLEKYVLAQPRDMDTSKGRDEIRSLAAKVSRTKTGLDELGKEFTAALKKQTGAVDGQRKLIRDRLDVLRDTVRAPLTAFEEVEADRIANHEGALVRAAQAATFNSPTATLSQIDDRIAALENEFNRDWEDFADRAREAYDDSLNRLTAMRAAAVQAEADVAELVLLRQAKVAADAREAARAAQDLAAKIAIEVAENQRLAEIARAERAAVDAENARLAEIARAEQAEQDAIRRANAAVEAERLRVAKVAADEAAAQAKLERSKKHRAKVHKIICDALAGIIGKHFDIAGPAAEQAASVIVETMAAGYIQHVSITY